MQAVRILAVASVLRPSRRLHVRSAPRLGPQRAQERGGVRGSGANFDIVRLQQRAALPAPVVLKRENDLLEREHRSGRGVGGDLTGSATGHATVTLRERR